MIGSGKKNGKDGISEKEKERRKEEDILFERIASQPTLLRGAMDILGPDVISKSVFQHREVSKKNNQSASKLAQEENKEERPKRKRGRPRSSSEPEEKTKRRPGRPRKTK